MLRRCMCGLDRSRDELKKKSLSNHADEIATEKADDSLREGSSPQESMEPEPEACHLKETVVQTSESLHTSMHTLPYCRLTFHFWVKI